MFDSAGNAALPLRLPLIRGGARKVRWAIAGRGKRGGTRTIYYYHNQQIPLFLLDVYAKNERANFTEADKRTLKRVLAEIVKQYAIRS